MIALLDRHDRATDPLAMRWAPLLLPVAARLVFAAVLLVYFWKAAHTKLGPGQGRGSGPGARRLCADLPARIRGGGL